MDFSLCLNRWMCIVRFRCEKEKLQKSLIFLQLSKIWNTNTKALILLSSFSPWKHIPQRVWELGYFAQRRSFSLFFNVHWLSLCVVSTSPSSFIFHFRSFSLGHQWGFHGKKEYSFWIWIWLWVSFGYG